MEENQEVVAAKPKRKIAAHVRKLDSTSMSAKIRSMHAQGLTPEDISELLKIKHGHVLQIIRNAKERAHKIYELKKAGLYVSPKVRKPRKPRKVVQFAPTNVRTPPVLGFLPEQDGDGRVYREYGNPKKTLWQRFWSFLKGY